jgi:carotenoid cleavage dioxygenase-like enzyme
MNSLRRPARLSRRAFLERSALAASGFALSGPFLPGCSSSAEDTKPDPGLPFDPNVPWWLQGNYAPVFEELDAVDLKVRGAIPPELTGLYARNGSNPQKSDSPHWFFGDGMIHGVRLDKGKAAWYRNRYVRTNLYLEKRSFGGDGAPPSRGDNQGNVSLVHHAGKLLTSGEVGFPFEIDTASLETLGLHDFGQQLETSFTAHPKIDPVTGHLHFFGYWFVEPYLTYSVVNAQGVLISKEAIQVEKSTMIHSFAITENDAIFWELPVLFDLQAAIAGAVNPFKWDASYGARIGVMPLGGKADQIRWVEIDPCYVFHEINAFRDGDEVVIDVCRHQDMFAGDELGDKPHSINRWRVNTAGESLSFRDEVVSDLQYELPTHDRRYTGRKHRYGWFMTTRDDPNTINLGGTGRIDFETGESSVWDAGPTRHADEAFFVPGGAGEGEGYLFSYVYDHARNASDLVILDATNVGAGPIAEIELPQRVPHGFHGVWVPG